MVAGASSPGPTTLKKQAGLVGFSNGNTGPKDPEVPCTFGSGETPPDVPE